MINPSFPDPNFEGCAPGLPSQATWRGGQERTVGGLTRAVIKHCPAPGSLEFSARWAPKTRSAYQGSAAGWAVPQSGAARGRAGGIPGSRDLRVASQPRSAASGRAGLGDPRPAGGAAPPAAPPPSREPPTCPQRGDQRAGPSRGSLTLPRAAGILELRAPRAGHRARAARTLRRTRCGRGRA